MGVWGQRPQQAEACAEGKGSEHASDPCRRHGQKLVVENDRARKAQAEAARQEEKLRKIRHTAEFEHADIAHEDVVDATPRPCFTPKPTRNSNKASLRPVAEVSDDCSDESNSLSYQPLCSEKSDNEEESAVEGDLQPPTKRLKAQTTGRAKPKVGTRAKKSRKAAPRAEEMELGQTTRGFRKLLSQRYSLSVRRL
jgi:hypothetical protein